MKIDEHFVYHPKFGIKNELFVYERVICSMLAGKGVKTVSILKIIRKRRIKKLLRKTNGETRILSIYGDKAIVILKDLLMAKEISWEEKISIGRVLDKMNWKPTITWSSEATWFYMIKDEFNKILENARDLSVVHNIIVPLLHCFCTNNLWWEAPDYWEKSRSTLIYIAKMGDLFCDKVIEILLSFHASELIIKYIYRFFKDIGIENVTRSLDNLYSLSSRLGMTWLQERVKLVLENMKYIDEF